MCLFSMKIKEMVGKKFGRLKVFKFFGIEYGVTRWKCRCSCGSIVVRRGPSLRSGNCRSCGCLRREVVSKRRKTHGMSETLFYKCWKGISERCENKKSKYFRHYGGRGVKCFWDSFEDFKKDMYSSYKKHLKKNGSNQTSLDRIDVNGHYSKENCRWATRVVQNNNTRRNHFLTFKNKTKTLREWSRTPLALKNGINSALILYRINSGWPKKEILTVKVRSKRHKRI